MGSVGLLCATTQYFLLPDDVVECTDNGTPTIQKGGRRAPHKVKIFRGGGGCIIFVKRGFCPEWVYSPPSSVVIG